MRTFSTVEGLPVVVSSTGKECGHVLDLLFKDGKVIGYIIDQIGWLNKHLFLPLSAILSYGDEVVMIKDDKSFQALSPKKKDAVSLKNGKNRLYGTALLTKEGIKLGLIEDVYFLGELGTMIGYEVTDGLVADLLEGRKVIKSKGKLVIAGGRAILTD